MYAVSPAGSVSIFPFGSQIGRQGENITLTCATQGGPNNSFVWEQNGQVLVGENENQLTVMIVNSSSGGVYGCTVSNAAGSGSASTILSVEPYIVTPLDEQIVAVVGTTLNITCEADGFPSPTVTWLRVSDTDMTTIQVSSTSQLEIVVTSSSAGVYRCVAEADINWMTFNATDEITLFGKSYHSYYPLHTCARRKTNGLSDCKVAVTWHCDENWMYHK